MAVKVNRGKRAEPKRREQYSLASQCGLVHYDFFPSRERGECEVVRTGNVGRSWTKRFVLTIAQANALWRNLCKVNYERF